MFHKEVEAEKKKRVWNFRPQRRLKFAAPGTLITSSRDPGMIHFERLLLVHEPGEVFGKRERPRTVVSLGPLEF